MNRLVIIFKSGKEISVTTNNTASDILKYMNSAVCSVISYDGGFIVCSEIAAVLAPN